MSVCLLLFLWVVPFKCANYDGFRRHEVYMHTYTVENQLRKHRERAIAVENSDKKVVELPAILSLI